MPPPSAADIGVSPPSVATTGEVVFSSDGDNLFPGDWNHASDVFVRHQGTYGMYT